MSSGLPSTWALCLPVCLCTAPEPHLVSPLPPSLRPVTVPCQPALSLLRTIPMLPHFCMAKAALAKSSHFVYFSHLTVLVVLDDSHLLPCPFSFIGAWVLWEQECASFTAGSSAPDRMTGRWFQKRKIEWVLGKLEFRTHIGPSSRRHCFREPSNVIKGGESTYFTFYMIISNLKQSLL